MNFEKIKDIAKPIESNNKEKREEALHEKIKNISLIYAHKKFLEVDQELRDNGSYKLSDALDEFSLIRRIIFVPLYETDNFDMDSYQENTNSFYEDVKEEIDKIYAEHGFDLEKISNLITSKRKKIIKDYHLIKSKFFELGKGEEGLKILQTNKVNDVELDVEGKYRDIDKVGFSKLNSFIEIHMEKFYLSGEKNLSIDLIKKDLGVIAERIIDKEPEVAAIIGGSWLLDTPIAKYLGFQRIDNKKSPVNDFSTWMQFIDKNGQIDQKRFNQLLESGEPPYKSVRAYIKTEDFLRKYLPEDRRGKVTLKEIVSERRNFFLERSSHLKVLAKTWDQSCLDDVPFSDLIEGNKGLDYSLSFLSEAERKKYLDFLEEMHRNKISWSSIPSLRSEALEVIYEKMKEKIKEDVYQDKELFI